MLQNLSFPHRKLYRKNVAPVLFPTSSIILLIFILLVGGCKAEKQSEKTTDATETTAPVFEKDTLNALTADIKAGLYPNTHALLIEYEGVLIYEQYFQGTDVAWGTDLGVREMGPDSLHDLRSVSKSITSLVLGIALKNDLQKAVDRPMIEYFPGLQIEDPKKEITLHQVLTMTAGLGWNEMDVPYTSDLNDEIRLYDATDPVQYVFDRPLANEPGSTWYYSGGTSQVLASLIHKLTGQSVDDFAQEHLFAPLGIDHFEWLGPGTWEPENPAAMSGLRLTAPDLAKIGSLFLNEGRWEGKQIVPEKWIELSGTRFVEKTTKWSEDGLWGYGYQWWVGNPKGKKVVAGVGNGNQRLFIVPEDKLVVTIFAGEYDKFEGHSNRLLYRILENRK